MQIQAHMGKTDSFTDVGGLRVGHAEDEKILTGTTVIIPDRPVAMAADVRGGGPGTRDIEALDPSCLVEKVHGLVLSGGSVFGLAAADGVTSALSDMGVGLPLGPKAVPVVPAAILFDLMNRGDKNWGDTPPYAALGRAAVRNARYTTGAGRIGAGYGARAGAEPGGIGTASLETDDGIRVGALVAVNSFGSVMDESGHRHGLVDLPKLGLVGGNTTIAAVATNLDLSKAACRRLAMMAQDGLARSVRPIHTPFDGDTVFALATGEKVPEAEAATLMAIVGTLAADCLDRAVRKAVGRVG